MSQKITYALDVRVSGGPSLAQTGTIETEAYAKIEITVPADAADKEVNLQPGGSGLTQFLLITASTYDDPINYKINAASNPAIDLDGPHLFMGKGVIGILDGGSAPTKLFFTSPGAQSEDVDVTILIGRDATP
jgi:hypothetical protein